MFTSLYLTMLFIVAQPGKSNHIPKTGIYFTMSREVSGWGGSTSAEKNPYSNYPLATGGSGDTGYSSMVFDTSRVLPAFIARGPTPLLIYTPSPIRL